MKKNTCLSALFAVLIISASSVMSSTSTITGGYAHGDMPSLVNKTSGVNLKYRQEQENDPISIISSFTYTEKNHFESSDYKKGQYYGISIGPAYRVNEKASIYAIIGAGYGRSSKHSSGLISNHSDYDFNYGVGFQINPIDSAAIDFSYEQSRIRNIDVSAWVAGIGYRF